MKPSIAPFQCLFLSHLSTFIFTSPKCLGSFPGGYTRWFKGFRESSITAFQTDLKSRTREKKSLFKMNKFRELFCGVKKYFLEGRWGTIDQILSQLLTGKKSHHTHQTPNFLRGAEEWRLDAGEAAGRRQKERNGKVCNRQTGIFFGRSCVCLNSTWKSICLWLNVSSQGGGRRHSRRGTVWNHSLVLLAGSHWISLDLTGSAAAAAAAKPHPLVNHHFSTVAIWNIHKIRRGKCKWCFINTVPHTRH